MMCSAETDKILPLLINQRMEVIILFVDDFYFIYLFFFHMTCNFICIYLVICFHFVFVYRTVNVMSFHALTVQCQISLLEAIISI